MLLSDCAPVSASAIAGGNNTLGVHDEMSVVLEREHGKNLTPVTSSCTAERTWRRTFGDPITEESSTSAYFFSLSLSVFP